jgi:hypothetical protein
VDGDGLPDLLTTDGDGRAVWLLPQNPLDQGRFLPPRAIVSGSGKPYDAAIADLDGDGSPDVAVTMGSIGSSGLLLDQDPAQPGAFVATNELGFLGSPVNIVAGDIDGDGRADLLASVYLGETGMVPDVQLAIALQHPDGTLGPSTALASQHGLNVGRLAIADYDGDGRDDLFVFFTPSSADFHAKLTVLLQGPQPDTFSAPIDTSLADVRGIDGATVADLDGDGRPDVAVVGFFPVGSPTVVQSRLDLFRRSGGGAFTLTGLYDMPVAVSRVAAGDVDGDGLNDLVVLGGEGQALLLLQSQTARGTFGAPRPL